MHAHLLSLQQCHNVCVYTAVAAGYIFFNATDNASQICVMRIKNDTYICEVI